MATVNVPPPTTASPLMTTQEMLALPANDVERWLIDGKLREKPMTVRNRWHSRIMVRVSYFFEDWLVRQPEPRGQILCGEAGVRLRRNPDTTVGTDVVYVSAELAAQQTDQSTLIDGVPVLVVEILSPNDTQDEIGEKIETYLEAGVRLVWIIDPRFRTVAIYRPGARPRMVNEDEELAGDPELPGFRVSVAQLFD